MLDRGLVAPGELVARPPENGRDPVALARARRPPPEHNCQHPRLIEPGPLRELLDVDPVLEAKLIDALGCVRHESLSLVGTDLQVCPPASMMRCPDRPGGLSPRGPGQTGGLSPRKATSRAAPELRAVAVHVVHACRVSPRDLLALDAEGRGQPLALFRARRVPSVNDRLHDPFLQA